MPRGLVGIAGPLMALATKHTTVDAAHPFGAQDQRLCASAEELLPGIFSDDNGTLSWQPAKCARFPIAEGDTYSDAICEALTAGANDTRRILFIGDSTVRNLFVASVSSVLAPIEMHEHSTAAEVLRCRGDRRFDTAMDQAHHLPSNCSFASRCGGGLELRLWMPPEPFASGGQRVPLRTHLETQLASYYTSRGPDGVIASIGTHYYAGYIRGVPHVNVTRAYAQDIAGLVSALASRGVGSLAYFTGLRPVVEKKPLRWRSQNECVVAVVNAVAVSTLHHVGRTTAVDVTVLDGLEWTRGLANHSTDGTHYDVPTLLTQGSMLLEMLAAAPSRRQRVKHDHSLSAALPRAAGAAPCLLEVSWVLASSELHRRQPLLARLPADAARRVAVSANSSYHNLVQDVQNYGSEDREVTATLQAVCTETDDSGDDEFRACSFVARRAWFLGNHTHAFVLYHCSKDCPRVCGEGGGNCGRSRAMRVLRPNDLVELTCPEFEGPECQASVY